MKAKNLKRKDYPYICKKQFEYITNNNDYKTERGVAGRLSRVNEEYRIKAEREDVKELEIHINWVKSKTWGTIPHASFTATTKSGNTVSKDGYTAGGCGYDKASAVVSDICDDVLSGMLFRRLNNKRKRTSVPYGIDTHTFFPYFQGGTGLSCYYSVFEFLGGKMEHVVDRPNYDYIKVTFK